jgi:hypothetical protein
MRPVGIQELAHRRFDLRVILHAVSSVMAAFM